jgi:sugar phosphate isomerase/epimerase
MEKFRIGTYASGKDVAKLIPQMLQHGFESFAIDFEHDTSDMDFARTAKQVSEILTGKDIVVSCLSMYGNPLEAGDDGKKAIESWERLIDNAHLFGTNLVTGFTGRLRGRSIPDSIPRFKEVFGELSARAMDRGVRLAFENCSMGGNWETGDWNIAHYPAAWELMFGAVPSDNLGLEWEPCHQMVRLTDPVPQLRKWVGKVFHVHGKDATIAWDIIREYGIGGPKEFVWHRTPGFGDCNWTDIITILRQGGYKGTIDIEGWHDPVYRDELEMTGQVRALNYLKQCRGGDYIPNPF